MAILREIPDELGVLLWRALRAGLMWRRTPPANREGLFSATAPAFENGEARGLAAALAEFSGLQQAPAAVKPLRVARASQMIAGWAEGNGHTETASLFAELAAVLQPRVAALAVAAGRLARRAGRMGRADQWLRYGLRLARASSDQESYLLALSGLGNLAWRRGNFPAAERLHRRCLRVAREGGQRHAQAQALHALFILAMERGRMAEAMILATAAFEVMGPHSNGIRYFAHDVAYLLLKQGAYRGSITVMEALLPHIQNPVEQIVLWGNLARAAGGAGDRQLFERARLCVWDISQAYSAGEHNATALFDLASGASWLGEMGAAAEAAAASLALATERREGKVQIDAEELHTQIVLAMSRGGERLPAGNSGESAAPSQFVRDLVRALR